MLMKMKVPRNTDKLADSSDAANADSVRCVSARLLSLLVCPLTCSALIYDAKGARLISLQAGLCYPIKGQVPIMLEEAATLLSEEERAQFAHKAPAPSDDL